MQVRSEHILPQSDFVRQNMAAETDRRRQEVRKLQRVEHSKPTESPSERQRTVGRHLNTRA